MYYSAKVYLKQQSSQYPDGSIQMVDSQVDLIVVRVMFYFIFCSVVGIYILVPVAGFLLLFGVVVLVIYRKKRYIFFQIQ